MNDVVKMPGERMRVVGLTCLAMLAFAANSLLCRMALVNTDTAPASFTLLRVASGAVMLVILLWMSNRSGNSSPKQASGHAQGWEGAGSWLGALALFIYAAGFSFAYVGMNTGTGALLLFGAVQLTMLSVGWYRGDRFNRWQVLGFSTAVAGLVWLLSPGQSVPGLGAAMLMLIAGVAWGVYSLLGKRATQPLAMTTGNFVRALPIGIILLPGLPTDWPPLAGVGYAIASGALASGAGYAIWYAVMPYLSATVAASIQLSVPVIAMLLGWIFLAEVISVQMAGAALLTLGGIGLVIRYR